MLHVNPAPTILFGDMNRPFPRHLIALALLLACFGASACEQDQAPAAATGADSNASATATAGALADVAFIDSMVPHHTMGVHMVDMELERGSSQDVKALAQKIKDGQVEDVATMQSLRRELTGADSTAASGMIMDQMMKDPSMRATMDSMMAMQGTEMDQAFLRHMTRHHREGIDMSRRAQPRLKQPELQILAQKMMDTQEQEIGEMRRLQEK